MPDRCSPRLRKLNWSKATSRKRVKGLSDEQIALMERESANLDREFKIAEQSYGTDHLDLVLANGYLGKLLGNARVVRYLAQHQQEISPNFRRLLRWKQLRPEHALHAAQPVDAAADGDPDPISAGTAGEAARWGGSSAVVGMAANPFGAH